MSVSVLKARVVANDRLRPVVLSPFPAAPLARRTGPQIRHIRLAPAKHRPDFSWAACVAILLLAALILLLGGIGGTFLWFIHDAPHVQISPVPSKVMARLAPALHRSLPPVPFAAASQTQSVPVQDMPHDPAIAAPAQTAGDAQIVMRENGSVAADDLLDAAHTRLEQGDNSLALTLYERVLAVEPGNRDALQGKAYALARIASIPGASQASFTALQRMETILPDDFGLQAALGKILVQRGKDSEAIAHLERAARLAPADIPVHLNLAILYDHAGKTSGALQLYRQILQAIWSSDSEILPPETLDSIRRRAAYLTALRMQS